MSYGIFPTLVMCLGLVTASTAWADEVSDYQSVVGKRGCDSIADRSQRSNCKSQQRGVNDYCKGKKGPVTCTRIDTRQMRNDIDQAEKGLKAAARALGVLKSKKSKAKDTAEKSSIEKAIDKQEDVVDAAKKTLTQRKKALETAKKSIGKIIKTLDKCIDYREAVMNVFARAEDKAGGVRNPEIKDIARKLKGAYKASISGHRQAIAAKENAHRACKDKL